MFEQTAISSIFAIRNRQRFFEPLFDQPSGSGWLSEGSSFLRLLQDLFRPAVTEDCEKQVVYHYAQNPGRSSYYRAWSSEAREGTNSEQRASGGPLVMAQRTSRSAGKDLKAVDASTSFGFYTLSLIASGEKGRCI